MTVLDTVLFIAAALIGGLSYGLAQAWWRDRHPMRIELRHQPDGSVLLSTTTPIGREELRALKAAVAQSEKLVLDESVLAKGWKFGSGPMPEVER